MELTEAKQRARATWSAGDYDGIVDYIWSVGGDLVARVGVKPGDEVLDVACGTGNAAIPAAQARGNVIGLDLTSELFEAGRRRAAEAGVEIEWVEGDAESLRTTTRASTSCCPRSAACSPPITSARPPRSPAS
jgi:2-polyprenyl-3-methyl-5-hydroxy-6-metoxy-1,4-benzoquinol methylase